MAISKARILDYHYSAGIRPALISSLQKCHTALDVQQASPGSTLVWFKNVSETQLFVQEKTSVHVNLCLPDCVLMEDTNSLFDCPAWLSVSRGSLPPSLTSIQRSPVLGSRDMSSVCPAECSAAPECSATLLPKDLKDLTVRQMSANRLPGRSLSRTRSCRGRTLLHRWSLPSTRARALLRCGLQPRLQLVHTRDGPLLLLCEPIRLNHWRVVSLCSAFSVQARAWLECVALSTKLSLHGPSDL